MLVDLFKLRYTSAKFCLQVTTVAQSTK